QTIVGGTTYDGAQVIDVTAIEALLVRKDGDIGDVFIVDTTNSQAEIYSQLGIGKVPASGIELDVLGDAVFTGGITSVGINAGSGLVTTSGNITTTGTGAITAANGLTATAGGLTVSAGGASVSGGLNNNTGGITNTGAISGASTIVASSYVRSLRTIYLVPEYENSLVIPDSSNNRGTLKSTYSGGRSYYEWTTNEPTTQDYDIVVRVKLPDGFSSFDATAPIKLWNKVSDATGSTAITVTMLDTADAAVTLTGGTGLKNTAWTESTITIGGTPTFTAGGYVTIFIKMFTDQNDTVNAGELSLKGNW
ncbi:MAG: hypothetical protein L6246_02135, partial [Thermodesulfovibrionales bacterium]|nr:hypothetical protein [Thermodesulfovibrionales bacterium]